MNRNYPHFAIPEIYGESLSYYELLRKLVKAMNVMIENYDTIPDQIAEVVANLDASQLFSTVLNQLIHSIATDNTKSTNAVKVYKKHDLLYATFNKTVNLYESLIDFTRGTETELIVGENIREVNISELLIELRKIMDDESHARERGDKLLETNIVNEARAREQADQLLQTNIGNEARAREQADQLLQTNIGNEARAREQADNVNSAEIYTMQNDIASIENKNAEQDNELSTLRTMLSSPYNFKGEVSSISALPASGNINDTYYVQDVKYKVTWTGSAWVQSSMSEADYQTELGELDNKAILGGSNIWDGNASTNYYDLDTVPCNRVILYTNRSAYQLANAPTTNDGLFYSVARSSNNSNVQDAIFQYYSDNNKLYYRTKYGTRWTSWSYVNDAFEKVKSKAILGDSNIWDDKASTNYYDLDTVPCNRIILYTNRSAYQLANAPTTNDGLFYSVARSSNNSNEQDAIIQYYSDNNKLYYRTKYGTRWTKWSYDNNVEAMSASISQFPNIGIVGDSYASGEIVLPPDYQFIDYYNLSWGQCIARRNGITCTNYSAGGLSTRTWLIDKKGKPLLDSSEPDNLYLLALGINDANNFGLDYLGSIEDIKSDYTQNSDTFYGNYGKIISIIMAKSSTAKIVMLDLANDDNSELYNTYNTAIKEIAEHFEIPCIHENDDDFFNSTFYKNKSYGHPTATTYSGMALAIERLFSKCCINNVTYFRDYVG